MICMLFGVAVIKKDYSKINNESCGKTNDTTLRGSDLLISSEQEDVVFI